jgi:heme/copper-type cytochrome/quinol oxidase subunit 3
MSALLVLPLILYIILCLGAFGCGMAEAMIEETIQCTLGTLLFPSFWLGVIFTRICQIPIGKRRGE